MPDYHLFDQDGTLLESSTLPDPEPGPPDIVALADQVAALTDAVDTLILDSLGGSDV